MSSRSRWLSVREPLPAHTRAWLSVLAFLMPLGLWCLVSYVPFLWHPLVLVTDAGDRSVPGQYGYLAEEQRVERERSEAHEAAATAPTLDDFLEVDDDYEIEVQHYAFLVSEEEFDQIFGRIQARALPYFADPHGHEPGEINTHDGGRGVYWADPSGNILEIITVPYGGWPS